LEDRLRDVTDRALTPGVATGVNLDRLSAIVGAENVVSADRIVADRQDTAPASTAPIAYVSPATADELRNVVDWARHNKVSVWPSGQGRNWGYGATVPLTSASVVVLLRRMNRVLHIDPDLAYAVIEPGVTYQQLYETVSREHPRLWIDCIDGTPNGSVLGNALERGVGPTPYGDHYGQLCGLEVLLPTGETIQTGGMRDSATRHTYRWGCGPVIDGLFSQSNMGIVLNAGIWLMPRPEHFRSFLFESREGVAMSEIARAVQPLFVEGVLRGAIRMINAMTAISLIVQYPNPAGQCMTEAEIESLRKRLGIAPWTLSAGLYGTRAAVNAQIKRLKRALGDLGRLEFLSDPKVAAIGRYVDFAARVRQGGIMHRALESLPRLLFKKPLESLAAVPYVHRLLQGQPTEYFVRHAYFKMAQRPERDINPARDGCGVIWFAPIVPNRSTDVTNVLDLGAQAYREFGFEYHVAMIFQNPRSVIVLMSVFYFKDVMEERDRADALVRALGQRCRHAHYPEYRTGVSYMDELYSDDPGYASLMARLKRACDPDGLLAPRRYGLD
jgi:4-cresol dehydrogenase (hydroxylating) flavoprotein subunit